ARRPSSSAAANASPSWSSPAMNRRWWSRSRRWRTPRAAPAASARRDADARIGSGGLDGLGLPGLVALARQFLGLLRLTRRLPRRLGFGLCLGGGGVGLAGQFGQKVQEAVALAL